MSASDNVPVESTSAVVSASDDDAASWEFWIDVGGTFTDCFARLGDGRLLRHKLLSSGVTKGSVGSGSTTVKIVDPARASDPADFWIGYRIRFFDAHGQLLAESTVAAFDATTGNISLAAPLESPLPAQALYELTAGEAAPILAIRYLMRLSLSAEIPPVTVRLGTTRGTNALLTRTGAKTALVTTRGFGDILRIGYQDRPRLFDLAIEKPLPLFTEVIEVDERVTHEGEVLLAPDPGEVRAKLEEIHEQGIESLAICLLHAYANPLHEQQLAEVAAEIGFAEVSISHQVAPLIKIVARGDTTVVDAYLNPVLRGYLAQLREKLPGSDLRVLTSAGGLVRADQFVGKDSILSGPAGGVVGFARAAEAIEGESVGAIGFDMGGTSTDVARYDGAFRREYETEKAGVRIVAPMMAIETVAAGGGSICRFDGVKLVVGPESAGAEPGPACYGGGGPLTVTDLNLVLGKILPEHFPFPLDCLAAENQLTALCGEIEQATGKSYTLLELADGFLRVANASMVEAIRSISIAEGADPRDYLLVAFGGAAGQHACAVARELGVHRVLNHPDAGILSAYGIGLADVVRHLAAGVYLPYSAEEVACQEIAFERLEKEASAEILAEGIAADQVEVLRSLDLRYVGLDNALTVPCPADGDYAAAYVQEHEQLYGYHHPDRELELVALRLEVIGRSASAVRTSTRVAPTDPLPHGTTTIHFAAKPHNVDLFLRESLQSGDVVQGPALILESNATTVIDPGWRAEVFSGGELLLTDTGHPADVPTSTEADPTMLEIFNNQFAAIAEQMGITLRNTASSVNVKERLDFSCAVFTPVGDLVVNAPHIPVHLGAMSETVRRILLDSPEMSAGDVFVTNDPFRGGSHLPDVTVVTPVFDAAGERLLFFTASRAHHAEIGGTEPGSMPPFSCNLAEEGVLIRCFKLIDAGQSRFEDLRAMLSAGEYPSRAVDDNLADIAAQVAANRQGARDLWRLVDRYSLKVVEAYMRHIQVAAETKMRSALQRLPDGRREWTDYLDGQVDGQAIPICVAVTIRGEEAEIDFTGTGDVLPGNLNANRAIVTAAVMYVMRYLIAEDIPLNEGVLAPIQIHLPEGLLNTPEHESPEQCAAVAGGNVETSQRVVDVLLGALGIAAASQGTMNNVLFGDGTFGYYETICGGSGATEDSPGADAVQTHMTNTRLTDPEVLEQRYPVRVHEFSIRRGSGGAGRQLGGDGVVRQLEFLRPLQVSILSGRRGPHPPYGLAGGGAGMLGRNTLRRADGEEETLPCQVQFSAEEGDLLKIETPGGGGYGDPRG